MVFTPVCFLMSRARPRVLWQVMGWKQAARNIHSYKVEEQIAKVENKNPKNLSSV